MAITNHHAIKAAKRDARERSKRQRVCKGCIKPQDRALGLIHSELACQRCGVAPCYGIVTAGDADFRVEESI